MELSRNQWDLLVKFGGKRLYAVVCQAVADGKMSQSREADTSKHRKKSMGLSLEGVFEIDRWLRRYHPDPQKPEKTAEVNIAIPVATTGATTRPSEFASRPPNPPSVGWVMR